MTFERRDGTSQTLADYVRQNYAQQLGDKVIDMHQPLLVCFVFLCHILQFDI